MTWQPDYVTSAELKAHLRITDTADDAAVALAATAASRAIDRYTGRQFGKVAAPVARVYEWDGARLRGQIAVEIDDLADLNGAEMWIDQIGDGVTLTSVDLLQPYVQFYPWNAGEDNRPWTHLVMLYTAPILPSYVPRSVVISALWGWAAVPDIVKQATLIQAGRFFVRRDSQYGIAGSPETGTELRLFERLDPDVALMLTTVKRYWGAA